jgi:hypothetical protein
MDLKREHITKSKFLFMEQGIGLNLSHIPKDTEGYNDILKLICDFINATMDLILKYNPESKNRTYEDIKSYFAISWNNYSDDEKIDLFTKFYLGGN